MSAPAEIDVVTAARLVAAGALLLDVREPVEHDLVRIEGSRHVPMRQIPEQAGSLPRDRDILVLCHHGGRSARVMQYLRAQGFDNVANVAGGIEAWATQVDPTLPRY